MTGYETLRVEVDDAGTALVTLDRPDRLNAISPAMWVELERLWGELARDEAVRVVVLTGAGRGFCAGLDLAEATDLPSMSIPEMMAGQEHGAGVIAGLKRLPKPVIAAVNGPAAGGGLALALAADVRLASTEARFGVAFIRLGLSACDVGVSWLLPRIVGLGHASELMLTGRVVDVAHAERIGLVNRVVEPDALLGAARELAAEMARNAPFALHLTKQVLQDNVDAGSLEAAITVENRNQVLASRTEDMRRAAIAFVTKTDAEFTGR